MKKCSVLLLIGLGLRLLATTALAQVLADSTNIADRVGQVIAPDRLLLDGSSNPLVNVRPDRPERPDLSSEIKLRLLRFEKTREAYLARQQALLRGLRGATTDDDRNALRARLKGLRDEWLERARAFREDARTRMRELQDELPRYREALIDAKEGALDAASTRKRRGEE